jgi:hypothetical protein
VARNPFARTKLAGWALAAAGCAASPAQHPGPARSPTRDYPEPLISASDGTVLGAHDQSPSDTLEAGPTNERPARGWKVEDGQLRYSPEDRGETAAPGSRSDPRRECDEPAAEGNSKRSDRPCEKRDGEPQPTKPRSE